MAAILDLRDFRARPAAASQQERVIEAALRCIGRFGVAKTTLDDVAREAGCSRATVYRLFPGGKDALLESAFRSQLARLFVAIDDAVAGATDLEDLLVAGITAAGRAVAGSDALQFLLEHEPEVILPRLAFSQLDRVLRVAAAFAAPYLAPWLGEGDDALLAAEWLARMVLSYTCSPAPHLDLTDTDAVRRVVRAFVVPGLTAMQTTSPTAATT